MKSIVLILSSTLLFLSCVTKDFNTGSYGGNIQYIPKPALEENEYYKTETFINASAIEGVTYTETDKNRLFNLGLSQSHIIKHQTIHMVFILAYGANYYIGEYSNKELSNYDSTLTYNGYNLNAEIGFGPSSEYFDFLISPGIIYSKESGDFKDFQKTAFNNDEIDSYNENSELQTLKLDLEFKFKATNENWFSLVTGYALTTFNKIDNTNTTITEEIMTYLGINFRIENFVISARTFTPISNVYRGSGTIDINYKMF